MSASSQLPTASLAGALGPRLRERRTELGKTLADVAGLAALSTGYLSSIEKGSSIPSLPVLARIAHALEISLAEILRSSGSARLAHGRIADAAGTERLAAEGSRLWIVQHAADAGESGRAPLPLDAGDVFIYAYQGRLEIVVDDGVFELGPGDALHCDRPRTITWRSSGEERSVAIWVSGADPRSR